MATQHRRCRSITSFINARRAAIQGGLGSMTVLNIMVTAHEVRWNAVEERIASHPSEARQLDENGKSVLFLALSRRMEDYPTQKIIQKIILADPCAVWEGIIYLNKSSGDETSENIGEIRNRPNHNLDYANSPLIIAAWRRANLEILQDLVRGRPSLPSLDIAALVALWNSYRDLYHESEEELVNLLFEGGRESFAIYSKLHCLLRYCTAPGNRLLSWPEGGTILHRAAAAPDCSAYLFQVILQQYPDLSRQVDNLGRLPLHVLLQTYSGENHQEPIWNQHMKLERLKLLVQSYPQATSHRDLNGRLPLHIAIVSGWSTPTLSRLVDAFPQSVCSLDGKTNLYPFQLVAAQHGSLSNIYKLLLASPMLVSKRLPQQEDLGRKLFRQNDCSTSAKAVLSPLLFERSTKDVAISTEVQGLLQRSKSINDDRLWHELQSLLRVEPASKASVDWLVLHAAVSTTECPIGFIRVLIHMHPEQLVTQDSSKKRTPLHYAAANSTKSLLATTPPNSEDDLRTLRLQAVLAANHSAAQVVDHAGQLPLHLAVSHGMPVACLESLILAWPDALYRRDGKQGLYPFQLSALSPDASLNDVYAILRKAPHVLVAASGRTKDTD